MMRYVPFDPITNVVVMIYDKTVLGRSFWAQPKRSSFLLGVRWMADPSAPPTRSQIVSFDNFTHDKMRHTNLRPDLSRLLNALPTTCSAHLVLSPTSAENS